MYIKRHNAAVMLIAEAIHKGHNGGCYTVMDACAENDTPEYSAGTRLPPWLLPGVPDDERLKMRPDLLVIPSIPLTLTAPATYQGPHDRTQHTVYILEIGYTGDLRHEKNATKLEQHQQLANRLQESGWKVQYSTAEAITLGVGGTIRRDLRPLLIKLGVTPERATRCCARLHDHAVNMLNGIVLRRRKLERELTPEGPARLRTGVG